ncbi:hypothetical protein OXYTRIMIC_480 [Oxytricha trifallax]|uniref:Uncharacterized protein n=1 Tax=Oxytricha trifallax TaxID=1172189 RepID=A0A073HX50_9SPIT|nr:hypothetical protein OXYTRIMIC_480 [Oxytricha trifallax]
MSDIDKKSFGTMMMMAEFSQDMIKDNEKFPFNEAQLAMYLEQRLEDEGEAEMMKDEQTVAEDDHATEEDLDEAHKSNDCIIRVIL